MDFQDNNNTLLFPPPPPLLYRDISYVGSSGDQMFPTLLNLFETLFSNEMDRYIVEEVSNESMTTYQNELLKKNENRILSEKYKSILYNPKNCRNNKCFICLEEYKLYERVLCIDCKHVFHKKCIKKAIKFNQKCPLCKINIETSDEVKKVINC